MKPTAHGHFLIPLSLASLLLALVPAPAGAGEDLSGLKAIVVLPPEKFRDEEFFETKKALEAEKIGLVVASRTTGKITGMLGGEAEATKDLGAAKSALENSDLIVFIGGAGTMKYFEDETVMDLIRTAVRQRKLVGAICLAPSLLARAGVLKGRRATVWASEGKTLAAKGAFWVKEPVVVDGRFVTGNGPKAAADFGRALVKWLEDRAESRKRAQELTAGPKKLRESGKHEEARKALQGVYEKNKTDLYVASQALFEIAFSYFQEKDFARAVEIFLKMNREFPRSDLFGMAQFNLGLILWRNLDKPDEAIRAFRELIAGDCNDWDDTGNLMNPYRNFRYLASLNIGEIHLQKKEPAEALQAFLDSYHEDYFVSHCGTCMMQATTRRAIGTARAAGALVGLEPDAVQGEVMKKASGADAYLLALGRAYLEAEEKKKAIETFEALRKGFPESETLEEIPEVK